MLLIDITFFKCLFFFFYPPGFGGGVSRKKGKEKFLLYLYRWMVGWMDGEKKVRIVTIATIY